MDFCLLLKICAKILVKTLVKTETETDVLKTSSKQVSQKTTGDFIGNKTADRSTKFWKTPQEDNSKIVTNKDDREIAKERYISFKKRQKTIDDLRLI